MELLSRDPALKAALFRLVDVAPACSGPRDVAAHLASLLGEVERPLAPDGVGAAAGAGQAARRRGRGGGAPARRRGKAARAARRRATAARVADARSSTRATRVP